MRKKQTRDELKAQQLTLLIRLDIVTVKKSFAKYFTYFCRATVLVAAWGQKAAAYLDL